MNTELGCIADTAQRAKAFFANPQAASLAGATNELSSWLQHRLVEMDRIKMASLWNVSCVQQLQAMRLPAEDAHALYETGFPLFWSETRGFYEKTLIYAQMPPIGWLKQQARASDLSAECLALNAETLYFGAIGLLSHFPATTLEGFEKQRPQLTNLPDTGMLTEKEAESRMTKTLNKYQERTMDLASLVGKEEGLVEDLEKRTDLLQKKAEGVAEMNKTLDAFKGQLAASKAKLRDKCRLNADDAPAFMWGKILRLHTAGMTNDLFQAMDQYLVFRKADPLAPPFIAGARAFYQDSAWATNGIGVLIAGFEHDQPHSALKVGDIVLSKNGQTFKVSDDFVKAPAAPEGQGSVFRVLRVDATGSLHEIEVRSRSDDPRVAVADLREIDQATRGK